MNSETKSSFTYPLTITILKLGVPFMKKMDAGFTGQIEVIAHYHLGFNFRPVCGKQKQKKNLQKNKNPQGKEQFPQGKEKLLDDSTRILSLSNSESCERLEEATRPQAGCRMLRGLLPGRWDSRPGLSVFSQQRLLPFLHMAAFPASEW